MTDHIDAPTYFALDGLNASACKLMLRSPAHYRWQSLQEEREPTPAQVLGTLVHAAVLEPERFARDVVVAPEAEMRTKAGREANAAWRARLPPTAWVATRKDYDLAVAMATAVHDNALASQLLHDSVAELTLRWRHPDPSLLCKARLDALSRSGWVIDLKTTLDARPESFARDVVRYDYDLQAAHYLAGARVDPRAARVSKVIKGYVFFAIEKTPPHAFAIYTAGETVLMRGEARRNKAIALFDECQQRAEWPAYPPQATALELPSWSLREMKEEETQ